MTLHYTDYRNVDYRNQSGSPVALNQMPEHDWLIHERNGRKVQMVPMQAGLLEDLLRLQYILQNPDIMKTASLFDGQTCPSLEKLLQVFELFTKDADSGICFYQIFNEDNEFIGIAGACKGRKDITQPPEIGYFLLPSYYQKGYATMATHLVLQDLKKRGITECIAHTRLDNFASQAVLRKNGFVCIDTPELDTTTFHCTLSPSCHKKDVEINPLDTGLIQVLIKYAQPD